MTEYYSIQSSQNAKSKREKRLAYERYQTKVNPYLE